MFILFIVVLGCVSVYSDHRINVSGVACGLGSERLDSIGPFRFLCEQETLRVEGLGFRD